MKKNDKYLIGNVLYDEDELLFYCKLGLNDSKKTLLLTVWGKNEKEVNENLDKCVTNCNIA